jgi:hypothetical protein
MNCFLTSHKWFISSSGGSVVHNLIPKVLSEPESRQKLNICTESVIVNFFDRKIEINGFLKMSNILIYSKKEDLERELKSELILSILKATNDVVYQFTFKDLSYEKLLSQEDDSLHTVRFRAFLTFSNIFIKKLSDGSVLDVYSYIGTCMGGFDNSLRFNERIREDFDKIFDGVYYEKVDVDSGCNVYICIFEEDSFFNFFKFFKESYGRSISDLVLNGNSDLLELCFTTNEELE